MTFAEDLPSECTLHVLSFLDLVDCLSFTSTCQTALKEALPALRIRRNRMTRPYAVATTDTKATAHGMETIPYCPSPTSSAVDFECDLMKESSDSVVATVGLLEDLKREYLRLDDITVLPTVHDRVKELSSLMAPLHSHPLQSAVQELCKSLNDNVTTDHFAHIPLSARLLIDALKQVMRPMKLQSCILKSVLLSSQDNGSSNLSQYLGDVLCVAYLLFDCDTNCSCAEGSPSSFSISEHIRKSPPQNYLSYVLMHAGILRTLPLTYQEKAGLGVHVLGNSLDCDMMLPTKKRVAARSVAQLYNRMASAWTIPMEYYRTEKFMNSTMLLVYDDFGPLGPSFRGRDIVKVRDITAHSMLACLSSIRSDGRQRRDTVEWLCLAHQQAVKTRPLTVRSPIIRIG